MNPHRIAFSRKSALKYLYEPDVMVEVPSIYSHQEEGTLYAILDVIGIWDAPSDGTLLIETPACHWTPAGYPWSFT